MSSKVTSIKLVVVGDGATGKTCLLLSYARNRFPQDYVPTVFDNYVVQITAGEETIELNLMDTAGQEEYDRLRPLSYCNANVFLCCFSRVNPASFENVANKWGSEITHYCPEAHVILVGTKEDLVDDKDTLEQLKKRGEQPISVEQGQDLAKKLRMHCFLSCSAYTGRGLKDVFVEAVRTVLLAKQHKKKKHRCALF